MSYWYEDRLFGQDMRHKPPLPVLPTAKRGWANSHGRLAYSQMSRVNERNYSEYALDTMGCMPKGYVIVNESEVRVNRETAIRCSRGRVAIPLKEFAKQRHLSLYEQWELMHPQWIGTFFGERGIISYHFRRPSLEQAMSDAMGEDRLDEFMQQFYAPSYNNADAIARLEQRVKHLLADLRIYNEERHRLRSFLHKAIRQIKSDFEQLKKCCFIQIRIELEDTVATWELDDLRRKRERLAYLDKECSRIKAEANKISNYVKEIVSL